MTELIDFVLHFDDKLAMIIAEYGAWTYAILFAIIFCETGLVVTPFLPGDSLLFAVGVFAGKPGQPLDIWTATILLTIAAILGDTVNYHVGKYLGSRILTGKLSRWLNPKHLERTHWFFERYGGKTIVLARFVPIVRTFAPFVAGVGSMSYTKFLTYNVLGGIAWVVICTQAGWWLAGNAFVEEHFEIVVLIVVAISLLPALVEILIHRYSRKPSVVVSESTVP
ncbi:MAG TPA: DedA family protein [Pirellulaceae bacterium]|nr:DedA family protein [Pirellulaceae bacterium]